MWGGHPGRTRRKGILTPLSIGAMKWECVWKGPALIQNIESHEERFRAGALVDDLVDLRRDRPVAEAGS
jgi:hypothetical protein